MHRPFLRHRGRAALGKLGAALLLAPLVASTVIATASPAAADGPSLPTVVELTVSTRAASPDPVFGGFTQLAADVELTDGGGSVAFTVDGTPIAGCQAVPLDANWRAVCGTYALPQGTHTVAATYSGHGIWAADTASTQLTVAPRAGWFVGRLVPGTNPYLSLAVRGDSTSQYASVVQAYSDGSGSDLWVFEPVAGGYHIRNNRSGLCVTTRTYNAQDLYQFACAGIAEQLFATSAAPASGGYLRIWNPWTSLCWDVLSARTTPDNPIIGYVSTLGANQTFRPVPVA